MGKITVAEVLAQIDNIKENTIDVEEKVRWLNDIDGKIKKTVIDMYEGGEDIPFVPYTAENLQAELLIEMPFVNVYLLWLESQIDYAMTEYSKYNISITRFNDEFEMFKNSYNRTHTHKTTTINYF